MCFRDGYPEVIRPSEGTWLHVMIIFSLIDKLNVTYSRSSGPGGQNVNKCM